MSVDISLVVNGAYQTKSSLHQCERIFSETDSLNLKLGLYKNASCYNADTLEGIGGKVLFFDKDAVLAELLEISGRRVVNSSDAIKLSDSKALTYARVTGQVKVPETFVLPKIYKGKQEFDSLPLAYPIVIKEAYGSLGAGVFLASNEAEARAIFKKIGSKDAIIQEFVANSIGRSIRVIAIKDKILGAVKFTNPDDFRSNGALGGTPTAYKLNKKEKKTVETVMKILGLHYAGIDLFDDGEGTFIEANSNAYFGKFEAVTGINVARELVLSLSK